MAEFTERGTVYSQAEAEAEIERLQRGVINASYTYQVSHPAEEYTWIEEWRGNHFAGNI